jgi:hypothetical protein
MDRKPAFRKLRCYALDPFLSLTVDTLDIHIIEYKLSWEELEPGPIGEYLEIIDYDPTSDTYYKPVNLNSPCIMVENGLDPSESNPQFHQQMVYAVAMKTIKNFEKALGRKILWSERKIINEQGEEAEEYVGKLRIYPHALRDSNAYYSPHKKALLFGYFQASNRSPQKIMPRSLVFSCLSHDIVTHEMTHAIIDGLFRNYNYPSNPDVLAFHEAFSDIVSLFQHFTFQDVLKHQIAKTKGRLEDQNMLGELAMQFGSAIGGHGSLRSAIGEYQDGKWIAKSPNPQDYENTKAPHARGSILVAAVFDAFLIIYKRRISDLLRLASGGSGILAPGEIHPDLVNRMAKEASKTSQHILNMCIRALDYCPALDITFGDFLRAIITADVDLVKNDSKNYRVAFIEAFKKRGIFPDKLKVLSVESLTWGDLDLKAKRGSQLEKDLKLVNPINPFTKKPMNNFTEAILELIIKKFNEFGAGWEYMTDRKDIHSYTKEFMRLKGQQIGIKLAEINMIDKDGSMAAEFGAITGLMFLPDVELLDEMGLDMTKGVNLPKFWIEDLHLVRRVGPDGNLINHVVLTLIQTIGVRVSSENSYKKLSGSFVPGRDKVSEDEGFEFYGSSTLIFDLDAETLKYVINKPLLDLEHLKRNGEYRRNEKRIINQFNYQFGISPQDNNEFNAYFGRNVNNRFQEPFSLMHNH